MRSPVVQSSEKRQPACYMSNSHFALCTFYRVNITYTCVFSCSQLADLIFMCRFLFAGIVVVNFHFAPSSSTFMFSAIRQLLHFAFYSAYTGSNSLTTTASIVSSSSAEKSFEYIRTKSHLLTSLKLPLGILRSCLLKHYSYLHAITINVW